MHLVPGTGIAERISTFIYEYNTEQYGFLQAYDRGDFLVVTKCNQKDYSFSAPSEYALSPLNTITDNSHKDKKAFSHSSSDISEAGWHQGELIAFSPQQ